MRDDDWIWRGIVFDYPIDQAVVFGKTTGKIVGKTFLGIATTATCIVLLDQPLPDGTKAVLVPADDLRLLTCHWCLDTKQVADTPFTTERYNADAILMKECPYCSERKPVRVL
jgi:hypothetical protein